MNRLLPISLAVSFGLAFISLYLKRNPDPFIASSIVIIAIWATTLGG